MVRIFITNNKKIVHKTLLIFYGIFFIVLINGLSSCAPAKGKLLNQKPTQIVRLDAEVGDEDDDEMVIRIKA